MNLFANIWRRTRGNRAEQIRRRKQKSLLHRGLRVERLEDRWLLAVAATLDGDQVTFEGDAAADRLYLRLGENNALVYSVSGQDGSYVADFDAAADGDQRVVWQSQNTILVELNAGDDSLVLDASLFDVIGNPAAIQFNGGTGFDRLEGPAINSQWRISGKDSGNLGDVTRFSSVENLDGGGNNEDVFVFAANGQLTGTVGGGTGGFDSLVLEAGDFSRAVYTATGPDSGTIDRDGVVISYAGMEPIEDQSVIADREFTATLFKDEVRLFRPEAGKITVESLNGTFESATFPDPTNSLTIKLGLNAIGTDEYITIESLGQLNAALTIEGGGGPDRAEVNGNLDLMGHALSIDAETIDVAAGITISTRSADGNGNSIADSGKIGLTGENITIAAGAQLLADVESGSAFSPGAVEIKASDVDQVSSNLPIDVIPLDDELTIEITDATIRGGEVTIEVLKESVIVSPLRPFGYRNKVVDLDISGSIIAGTDVSLSATAQDRPPSWMDEVPSWVNNYILSPFTSIFFDGILPPIPLAVMIRGADSSLSLSSSSITSSGDVAIGATSIVDATVAALAVKDAFAGTTKVGSFFKALNYFSAGYSQADTSAVTTLDGNTQIIAGGDVTVLSDAQTTAVVSARTTANIATDAPPNTKAIGGSVSVSRSNTTSNAIVGENVTIISDGNVNVSALGTVDAQAKSGVSIYKDGLGGVGIALGFDNSDVRAEVNGQITAVGSKVEQNLDVSGIDTTLDTITLPDHGLQTGQLVLYLAEDPDDADDMKLTPIGGLADGETYEVIVVDENTIQLARTSNLDLDASMVNAGATQTFNRRAAVTFDPQVAVNPATDTLQIASHGFTTGQELDYAVGSQDQNPIGGLPDSGPYYVIEIDADHFQLARNEADALATTPIPIDLTSTGEGNRHIFGFDEAARSFVASSAVDTPEDTITIPIHGYATGDAVVYRTDPTIQATRPASRWSTFLPDAATVTFNPTATTTDNSPVIDDAADQIIFEPSHSFVTGQKVVYSAGGGTTIGGLSEGGVYYIIRSSDDRIQLASSRADASAGQALPLGAGASGTDHTFTSLAVDLDADLIVVPSHNFDTGQQVTYFSGDGTPVGGLNDATGYFAIRLDDNLLQLATSPANASAGIAVNLNSGASGSMQGFSTTTFVNVFDAARSTPVVDEVTDTIELNAHGLSDGDLVTYRTSGGDPIGGLIDGDEYFVIKIDDNSIRLAANAGDVNTQTAIDLSAGATISAGLHAFESDNDANPLIEFDPTKVPPVDTTADTIRIPRHGYDPGESLTYLTGGGTAIGGLSDGVEYFVIVVDDDHVQLATTAADATAGIVVDFSGGVTGSRHGLERASTVMVGDIPISPLTDGETYFVTVVDANTIRLSDSQQDALAAEPIQLDPTQALAEGKPHSLKTDEGSGIQNMATLSATNKAKTGSGLGSAPTIKDLLTKGELQSPGYNAMQPSSFGKPDFTLQKSILTVGNSPMFSGSGSKPNDIGNASVGFGLNLFEHEVIAKIGSSAVLKSGTDVTVDAQVTQKVQVSVDSNVSPDKGGKKFSIAAGIGLGFYNNDVQAIIDDGAVVDASRKIAVTSDLQYPLLVKPIDLVPFAGFVADPENGSLINEVATTLDGKLGLTRIMNTWVATKAQAPDATFVFTGSVGVVFYDNSSLAVIGAGALINQDPLYQSADQSVMVDAATSMQLVNATGIIHLKLNEAGVYKAIKDKNAGKAFSLFGNQAKTLGIGGSALVQMLTNQTIARIETGARVHTGANGGLDVNANENLFSFEFAQAGGDSGKIGISGSLSLLNQSSETLAHLENGVVLTGGPVSVTADDNTTHITLVGAVQLAKAVGVGVSVGINEIDRKTAAVIGSERIEFDKDQVDDTDDGIEIVNHGFATGDRVRYINRGQSNQAIGGLVDGQTYYVIRIDDDIIRLASSAQNASNGVDIDLETTNAGANHILDPLSGSDAQIDADSLTLKANVAGQVWAFSLAGAIVSNTDKGSPAAATGGGAGSQATSGIGLAGDVSLNTVTDITQAYMNDQGTLGITGGGDLLFESKNDSLIVTGAGAATFAKQDKTGAAIAGSFSKNELNAVTESFLVGMDVVQVDDVDITADYAGSSFSITAGLSGAWASTSIAIAGSFSWNTIESTTQAYVEDVSLTSTGALTISATDDSGVDANAGGVAIAIAASQQGSGTGAVSVGASAAINDVDNTVKATIYNANVANAAGVSTAATSNSKIKALTLAGAGSGSKGDGSGLSISGAGSGSGNNVTTLIEAAIVRGSSVTTTAGTSVSLAATDTSTIDADAGSGALAAAFGQGGSFALAVGAAAATAVVASTVRSRIDESEVTSGGDLNLTAISTATVNSLTVGIGGAMGGGDGGGVTLAGAGSGSGNSISTTVEASISDASTVTTLGTGAIMLSATDSSTITADAGGVSFALGGGQGGGIGVAVGVSVAVNEINNTISAAIDSSTASSAGTVQLSATSNATVDSLTLAGAPVVAGGQGGGVAFSGAGAGSGNTINNTIEASIASSTITLTGSGAIHLAAEDTSKVTADSGGVGLAVAGGQGGGFALEVGAAISINEIENSITAEINRSTVNGAAAVDLSASSTATIDAFSIAAGAGGAGGEGGGIAIALNGAGSGNTIKNTIAAVVENSTLNTPAGVAVSVSAEDTSKIMADAGGVAIVGAGGQGGGVAGSAGLSVAINNTIQARVDTSQITFNSGDVSLAAIDNATIDADAGGIAISGAGGQGGGVAATVGLAVAINEISNTVEAEIDNSNLSGAVSASLTATSTATIDALTFAGGLAGAGGQGGGVALTGQGMGSGNTINNTIRAVITGASQVTVSGGGLTLTATDDSSIDADAGGIGIAGAGGQGGGVAGAVGVAVAINDISNTVEAKIDNSAVSGAANVALTATSTSTIDALTFAGVVGGAGGQGGGIALMGVGMGSGNTITNTVTATVSGNTVLNMAGTGGIQLSASDDMYWSTTACWRRASMLRWLIQRPDRSCSTISTASWQSRKKERL